jgi:hypothetical protein
MNKIVTMERLGDWRRCWNKPLFAVTWAVNPMKDVRQIAFLQLVRSISSTLLVGTEDGPEAVAVLSALECVDAVVPIMGSVEGRRSFLELSHGAERENDIFAHNPAIPATEDEATLIKTTVYLVVRMGPNGNLEEVK